MKRTDFDQLSPTEQRDTAIAAVVQRRADALDLARQVSDAWFRAQALAYAARLAADDAACLAIAREAIDAADACEDEYERAAARSWPISAMIERRLEQSAIESAIDDAVDRCRAIENPNRRAYALYVLTQATVGDEALWSRLREVVFGTAPDVVHWRGQQAIRDIALLVAAFDGDAARGIAGSMPECRARRQALRRLEAGEIRSPHFFHWST